MSTTCVAVVQGCADCERTSRCDGNCDDLCRLIGGLLDRPDGHAAMHRAEHCRRCGCSKYADDGTPADVTTLCEFRACRNWSCPACGEDWGSDGPVACPCSWPTWYRRLRFLKVRRWRKAAPDVA